MRAVRLAASAVEDIDRQLDAERAAEFRRIDLGPILDLLRSEADVWDAFSVPHGPGRRLTATGRTVAGFHLFGLEDTDDPRDGAIVLYLIDIWIEEFPE